MYESALRLQPQFLSRNWFLCNSNCQNPLLATAIFKTSLSISISSCSNPNFVLKTSHHPQKSIVTKSRARRNYNRRNPFWRPEKAVEKWVSFIEWNLRFLIAPELLDTILDCGGWGGGFGSRRKKGFGGWSGGFGRKWAFGFVVILVFASFCLSIHRRRRQERDLGFTVLVSALLGNWIRVFRRRRRRRWGLRVW